MFAEPVGYTMKRHTTGDVCLGFRGEIPPGEDLEEVTCG